MESPLQQVLVLIDTPGSAHKVGKFIFLEKFNHYVWITCRGGKKIFLFCIFTLNPQCIAGSALLQPPPPQGKKKVWIMPLKAQHLFFFLIFLTSPQKSRRFRSFPSLIKDWIVQLITENQIHTSAGRGDDLWVKHRLLMRQKQINEQFSSTHFNSF